jgi:hypothetical protein
MQSEGAVAAILFARGNERDLSQGAKGGVDKDRGKLWMREDCERDRHWSEQRSDAENFLRLGTRLYTYRGIAVDDALLGNRKSLAHTAAVGAPGARRLVVEARRKFEQIFVEGGSWRKRAVGAGMIKGKWQAI